MKSKRSLKSRRQDRNMVALLQKHERTYIKRITKRLLEALEADSENCKEVKYVRPVMVFNGKKKSYIIANSTGIKICKALLKYLER